MADWTANSGFGALNASREPVGRAARGAVHTTEHGLVAERRSRSDAEATRVAPGLAALTQYNAAQGSPLAKARFVLWAGGGALSLLLIAGVGFWGYKLVLNEVLGLPVVAAGDGPMRVLPSDPQGEVVPSQGLAVNEIPAAGTVAPPSDVLILAPPTPDLAEEDMEVVQTMAEADEVVPVGTPVAATPLSSDSNLATPGETSAAQPVASAPLAPIQPEVVLAEQPIRPTTTLLADDRVMSTAEVLAFADQVSGQAQPIGPETAEPTAQADTPPDLGPVEPSVAGLVGQNPSEAAMGAMALKPPSRPAALATAASDLPQLVETAMPSVTEAAGSASTSATPIVLTAGLPSGTHLVQLGAFDSPEIAASEWARLQRTFDEFLGGREHVVQETQSSGRTLYRLRALGFPERADARILCAALTAEGADCIAVTVD